MPGSSLGPMPGGSSLGPMPGGTVPGAPMPGGTVPGYAGPNGAASSAPKTLSERADDAFRKGNDREAFQLVYAAAISNDEAAQRLPDEFRWIASLKKPSLGVRWALGITYSPPRGYTGHPSPVGYEPPAASTNNNTPGSAGPTPGSPSGGQAKPKKSHILGQRDRDKQGYGGQSGGASSPSNQPAQDKPPPSYPPSDPAGFLTYYTGEVGDQVVKALSKRMTSGTYGPVLQHAAEVFESGPAPASNNNFPGGAGPTPGSIGPMPGGIAPPNSAGPMPGGIGAPGAPGGQNNPASKPDKFKIGAIVPGVVMLGQGNEGDLINAAEEQQVDFVILFEVSVRKSNKDATNNTKFRVLSLDKAKLPPAETTAEGEKPREIFVSSTINSKRVESAREDNKDDPLKEEIAGFEEAIDGEVVVTPLSEKVSTEEVALKRANYLASKSENQLANLAEIRQYQVAKLINDTDAAGLYEKILGKTNAEKFLKAKNEADRAAVLTAARLLPKT
jgi:hypothetical protein